MYKFYYLFFFVFFAKELDIQFNLKNTVNLHQADVIKTGGPHVPYPPPIPLPYP